MDSTNSSLHGGVALFAYLALTQKGKELARYELNKAVHIIAKELDINLDDAMRVVVNQAKPIVSNMLEDEDKREQFLEEIDAVLRSSKSASHEIPPVKTDFYTPATEYELSYLHEKHQFSDWSSIINNMNPEKVKGLAEAAYKDAECAAASQIHFWLAVIDYFLTAAFMSPVITPEQRDSCIKSAGKCQKIVSEHLSDRHDILELCNNAWVQTIGELDKFKSLRDRLYEMKMINQWGQNN